MATPTLPVSPPMGVMWCFSLMPPTWYQGTLTTTQLNRMGAQVTELPDGLEITGGTVLTGADVDSYTDHRIAMSLAIAALSATGKTSIHRAEAASISYPNFIATLQEVCKD